MKNIAIIGIGGYAEEHLRSIGILEQEGALQLCAAVVWRERHADTRKQLEERGVAIFESFKALMCANADIDIVSIPTGIMHHEEMICRALECGHDVMCEKPLTGTVAEAMRICKTVEKTRRICAIGYQNMYSPSIAKIKDITIKKQFGALISSRTIALWPRSQSYYARNEWAGELEFGGKKIYDSIAQNACAHFLQNMLFIAGKTEHGSANIVRVYGENYRAKDIMSADTQFIRVHTEDGVPITFVGTHCVMEEYGPITEYEYEHGKIRWEMGGKATVYDKNGDVVGRFDNENEDFKTTIFRDLLVSIETDRQPKCTPLNTMQHTMVIENAFASGVVEIPAHYKSTKFLEKSFYSQIVPENPDLNVVITGIEDICHESVHSGKSFAELAVPWALPGREILLATERL